MKSLRCFTLIVGILGTFSIAIQSALAATGSDTWTGTDGGSSGNFNWSDSGNWTGANTPPAANDTLLFDLTTGLNNTNDLAAGTQFNGIFFNSTAGAFNLYGNSIVLGGGITNNSANAQTINLGINIAGTRTLNATTGPLFIAGGVTNTANSAQAFVVYGTGTNSDLFAATGGSSSQVGIALRSGATWTILDGTGNGSQVTVANRGGYFFLSNAPTVLNFGSASSAPNLNFGFAGSGNSTDVGRAAGTGTNTFNMINGYLSLSGINTGNYASGSASTNVVNVSGGTLICGGYGYSGCNQPAGVVGTLNITGGAFYSTNSTGTQASFVATRGLGTLNVNGGFAQFDILSICRNVNSGGTFGTINLGSGGILMVGTLTNSGSSANATVGASTSTFNFNGGTLKAAKSSNPFLKGSEVQNPIIPITANVQAGGAIIDSTNFNITIADPLLHDGGLGATPDGGLTKLGSGVLTLSATNTYTGTTIINAGTLALSSSGLISPVTAITINSGATLDLSSVSALFYTNQIAMTNGSLLIGSSLGTPVAPVNTVSMTNSILQVALSAAQNTNIVTGTLNATTNTINISAVPALVSYPARFHILSYANASGNLNSFALGTLPTASPAYSGYISNNTSAKTIDLVLTTGPLALSVTWQGEASGNWDTSATNWLFSNSPISYTDGYLVTFDDSAPGATTVNVTATFFPSSVTVSNTTHSYTFNGSGAIDGSTSLIKEGSGTLLLSESGGDNFSGGIVASNGTVILDDASAAIGGGAAINTGATLQVGNNDANGVVPSGNVTDNGTLVFNRNDTALMVSNAISGSGNITNNGSGTVTLAGANTFSGAVAVNAGVLEVNNNAALGTTNGGTVIANGAALDIHGRNIGQESITVSGTGPDSTKGAIYNSGTNVFPAIARLTLTGNTTIGGPVNNLNSGRWDLRSPTTTDANGASLICAVGQPFNLTKVGANQVGIVGVTVDANLANIDVQGGILSIEGATTGLGNSASNLTVETGATLQFYQMTNLANKNIILQNSSSVISQSGNNTVVGPMTLNGAANFYVQGNGTLTLSNAISGSGPLNYTGTNTLAIAGTDSHTGGTTINDGTFILNGISSDPNNALTENISQGGFPAGVIVGGSGTNVAPVDIEDQLWPGVNGHPSTLTIGNGPGNDYSGTDGTLMFGAQGTGSPSAIFNLGSSTTPGGGVNDLIVVNGDFDANFAHVKINPLAPLNTSSPYTLVTYTGSKGFNFNGVVNLVSGTSRYSFALNYPANAVTLSVSGGPALLQWNNNSGDGLWNVQSSQNWLNTGTSSSDVFYNFDTVIFDDSILSASSPVTNINLAAAVSPAAVTNNSSSANYTFSGTGKITGSTGLTKQGSSTLTIDTTNDFTGDITIAAGTVVVQNSGSLGATNGSGTVTIAGGATLSLTAATVVNSLNFGAKPFVVSGSGVGGNGAIFSASSVNQQNTFQNVTLTGNTVFGGSGRWDIRASGGTAGPATAILSTTGHAYKLTKTGTNFIGIVSVTVDPALADIDVTAGTLDYEGTTTGLGNPTNTLTVFTNATLFFYNTSNALTKTIVVNDGGIINNNSGSNVIAGPITLNTNALGGHGNVTLNIGGVSMTINGIISGAGGFTKTGANILILNTNNTYTGNTLINAGTVALGVNGAISVSSNITVASGTTLDASGRSDSTLTLNSGQTLSGVGTINGSLTNLMGSISLTGTNGTFTVANNATLGGSFTNLLGPGTNTVFTVAGNLAYGGTLTVTTNASTVLVAGTHYKLFKAPAYNNGSFSAVNLPALPGSLAWTNGLAVDGSIGIVSSSAPPFTNKPGALLISLNGANIVVTGTNGQAGDAYYLLSSTNVALPLSQWTVIATNIVNSVGGNGSFTFIGTNAIAPADQQQFYILSNTNSNHQ